MTNLYTEKAIHEVAASFSISDPDPDHDRSSEASEKRLLPTRATDGSAGYDLRTRQEFILQPGQVSLVPTGVKLIFHDKRHCAVVLPRSGLAVKKQVTVINSPGLIDPDYTGEIQVGLIYHPHRQARPLAFNKYDRIAQLVFLPVAYMSTMLPSSIGEALKEDHLYEFRQPRGSGGFGSTGQE